MSRFLIGSFGALALVTSAAAADVAPYAKAALSAPVYRWSGFYLGANGGWGTSQKCWDFVNTAGTFLVSEGCHNASGGTAGGQLGYRWQAANLVFGIEAQGNWADFNGSNQSVPFPAVVNATRVESFGTFTGQIGNAWGNTLLYIKAGGAVTNDRYLGYLTATGTQISDTVTDNRWGAVVGVGLEYGFAANWSVGVAYDHMFMQDRLITFTNVGTVKPSGAAFASDRIHQDVDLVTMRLNYRWGG
ncbi:MULTISPECIES: outer membrane beta-barrel protein [Rhodopseudomonas]|uniref:Membrane protein n=1 Tax=Rhodopseudomonas palustris TaxID=1076 RepID=A0A0D7F404_RHOPL|nr:MULTISPECIES: outer membrane beta-barrel protein [Rhodopseudomonas]KIZ46487.1 membrane protein [Rhodopseudomonas palustris]MDF3814470.1 outer membrane beta-barrel protein [Rhodopseudomonas sp. BAL398]WOK18868.1 outer membrane beta-barrel protein [Rhodopseudomonas sp. BAL398]